MSVVRPPRNGLPTPVSHVAASPVQMQMPCPDCGTPLPLPLATLLAGRPLWCGACGIKLEVDGDASGAVLAQLERGLATLDRAREQASGAAPGKR